MKFLSNYSDLRISNAELPAFIEFKGGQYETTDKKEIAVIKKSQMFGVSIWEDKQPAQSE